MSKTEATTIHVLKTSICPTLSGKSKLTYQLGCTPDSTVHLRISKNSGGGFFSDEWVSLDAVLAALKDRPRESPVLSHFLTPLLKGKSVNTSAFLLAALTHLKLLRPLPKKKRVHELLDPGPFQDQVDKLITGGTTRKVIGTATKKAAVKKRATTKRKKATT